MDDQPDLFGAIRVTLEDVEIWIDVVPGWTRTSPRRAYYAAAWNVPEKIAQAKQSGLWAEILQQRLDQIAAIIGTNVF